MAAVYQLPPPSTTSATWRGQSVAARAPAGGIRHRGLGDRRGLLHGLGGLQPEVVPGCSGVRQCARSTSPGTGVSAGIGVASQARTLRCSATSAAFVMPIAFALYRVGIDAPRLAADPATMRLMVLATREAFTALHAAGNDEIPRTCAPSTACRRFSSSPTGGGCSTAPEGSCGSAHTAEPPPRRCTHSPWTCERRCATPGAPHPTSSGYWPPPREAGTASQKRNVYGSMLAGVLSSAGR